MTESKKIAICFDLDGTLTSTEILPMMAEEIGLFKEMQCLTKLTMQNLIPFEDSYRLRIQALSQIPIDKVRNLLFDKILVPEVLVDFINNNSESCFVVTSNLDIWVGDFISRKFGCRLYSSKARKIDGGIKVDSILDKGEAIDSIYKEFDFIIVVGDGSNDINMFKKADYAISYQGVNKSPEELVKLSNSIIKNPEDLIKEINQVINEKR